MILEKLIYFDNFQLLPLNNQIFTQFQLCIYQSSPEQVGSFFIQQLQQHLAHQGRKIIQWCPSQYVIYMFDKSAFMNLVSKMAKIVDPMIYCFQRASSCTNLTVQWQNCNFCDFQCCRILSPPLSLSPSILSKYLCFVYGLKTI